MSKKGITIRLDEDTTNQCDYWFRKLGYNSRTQFVTAAIAFYIAYKNGDYPLANAETARLNQIVTAIDGMSEQLKRLQQIDNKGWSTLFNLQDPNLPNPENLE